MNRAALCVVSPLSMLAVCAPVDAAIMSLKAVAINNVPLPQRTNFVTIEPGDEITTELFISDWGDEIELVTLFQATILGEAGSHSGDSGTILPCGWPIYPEDCIFQDLARPDWIFAGREAFWKDLYPTLDVRFGALVFGDSGAPDDGTEKYGGTIILVASNDACGTFTFHFDTTATASYLIGASGKLTAITPEPLMIDVACLPRLGGACCPDNCAVDARYPHGPLAPGFSYLWDRVKLDVNGIDPAAMACSDFYVSAAGGSLPFGFGCSSVTAIGPSTIRVQFNNNIPTSRWICLRLLNGQPGSDQICLASLPGDVNADLISDGNDILSLLDPLHGGDPLKPWQCDIDRDGACTQLDLLALVDVLAGANEFVPWNGAAISVPCPSASLTATCGDMSEP